MEKSVILLSGPVGAGKTTVASLLVPLLPGPVAYIEGDKFWCFIAKGGETIGRFNNFKMIMRAMTIAAMPYTRMGYQVVLDFSVPLWYLDTLLKILAVRNIPLDYVVIRPSQPICAERAAARGVGTIVDYTPYKELYASFDAAQRYIIYDDEGDAAVIADHIIEGLNEGIFRVK